MVQRKQEAMTDNNIGQKEEGMEHKPDFEAEKDSFAIGFAHYCMAHENQVTRSLVGMRTTKELLEEYKKTTLK